MHTRPNDYNAINGDHYALVTSAFSWNTNSHHYFDRAVRSLIRHVPYVPYVPYAHFEHYEQAIGNFMNFSTLQSSFTKP